MASSHAVCLSVCLCHHHVIMFIPRSTTGPYSMGLFGAPRKRMIVSWSITAGVFSLVKVVKLLPYPYRSIIDAGVVFGLSYGTISTLVIMLKALLHGIDTDHDEDTTTAAVIDEGEQGKKRK